MGAMMRAGSWLDEVGHETVRGAHREAERCGECFQPQWLVVALEALLQDKRARAATTVGVEVDGATYAVRIDRKGLKVTPVDADARPDTVFRAEPMVVLGMAAGLLGVDEAIAAADLRGDAEDLAAVFGSR